MDNDFGCGYCHRFSLTLNKLNVAYFNEGNASFEFEGSIKDIGASRLLESFSFAGKGFRGSPDVDVSGMGLVFKDLLVGSDTGIYWAVYDEIDKGFSVQKINHSSFDLDDYLRAMRVVDIDGGSLGHNLLNK